MKVSVVIPVYNVEKYLSICIDSVLSQTYEDYEIILVDDGSTDTSGSICDDYAKKNRKIHVIHQKNAGLSSARNRGVKIAEGEYIFFLDSDDCIHPELLERTMIIAKNKHPGMIQIDMESVADNFSDYNKKLDVTKEKIFEFDTLNAMYNLDVDNKSIAQDIRLISIVAWSKLYRKDIVQKVAFPEEMRLHEDQMTCHRFLFEANGCIFLRLPLYFYRSRPASLITEGWTPKRLAILDCYADRLQYAKRVDRKLAEYVLDRYLVCMFKNCYMAKIRLTSAEYVQIRKMMNQRVLDTWKNESEYLTKRVRYKFFVFKVAPDLYIQIYMLVKRIMG